MVHQQLLRRFYLIHIQVSQYIYPLEVQYQFIQLSQVHIMVRQEAIQMHQRQLEVEQCILHLGASITSKYS